MTPGPVSIATFDVQNDISTCTENYSISFSVLMLKKFQEEIVPSTATGATKPKTALARINR